jgi:hypothetical protein
MDEASIARARERLDQAAQNRIEPADVDSALERARTQIEALAELAANIEVALPGRVEDAVRDGVESEARPMARQLAEVRGLGNQTIRRLERLEGDLLAERHARVDDLALLVDLITSGWKGVDQRLGRIERKLAESGGGGGGSGAVVYRMEERDRP